MTTNQEPSIDAEKPNARQALLEAAGTVLRSEGFAALSTRKVALAAGVPLSQIHYHFGSKDGLVVALLDHMDRAILARQEHMFDSDAPLSQRWAQACDFLDDDIRSGYVRLLQECTALGWSNAAVGEKMRTLLDRWAALLTAVAEEAASRFGALGPFTPAEVADLAGKAFMGAESVLLLGVDEDRHPIRKALRKVGHLIEMMEAQEGEAT